MTDPRPALLLGAWLATAPLAAHAAEPHSAHWHFTVLLDGKPIGTHDFDVKVQGDDSIVQTEAHFKVKAAFIPLYQYDHEDREVWHDGCLTRIDSHTRDNGKGFTVQGAAKGQAFEVTGEHGGATLPGCVRTFAYWDQRFLTAPRLLNSQTGDFQTVTLNKETPQNITVHGQSIAAQRYSLRAPKLDIDLWYSATGEWLALASRLESGRTLRYELR